MVCMCVFQVLPPGSFALETWAMTDEEKLAAVPQLHEEGNVLFKKEDIQGAADKYYNAIACLKNLQMKVEPTWREMERERDREQRERKSGTEREGMRQREREME